MGKNIQSQGFNGECLLLELQRVSRSLVKEEFKASLVYRVIVQDFQDYTEKPCLKKPLKKKKLSKAVVRSLNLVLSVVTRS